MRRLMPRRFRQLPGINRRITPMARSFLAPQRTRVVAEMPVMTSEEKRARQKPKIPKYVHGRAGRSRPGR